MYDVVRFMQSSPSRATGTSWDDYLAARARFLDTGQRTVGRRRGRRQRPLVTEGVLTLIQQLARDDEACLVLDRFTPRERNLADLVRGHFAAAGDFFGERRLGRVRITVESLAEEAG
jgi:hypothetical protein